MRIAVKRMIDFADKNNLEIVLAYYPPYFSKYNPIERCWVILENHWRATLLITIETTLEFAKNHGLERFSPVIKLVKPLTKKAC
jgi:transposase